MIRFTWANTARVDRVAEDLGPVSWRGLRRGEVVLIEPFLAGRYQKFNSNIGYEADKQMLLPAFAHWTFGKMNRRGMLCDLQGIKTDSEYLLTDPVIHTADGRYSATGTDLGVPDMCRVMDGHCCNAICAQLGLARIPPSYSPGSKATIFTFNLSESEREAALREWPKYFE
jgi:hypothetical protein